MNQKERIEKIIEALDAQYGTDFICYLEHKNALELLIATILSAQCTDARVNTVTPTLFAKYKNAKDFANADLAELEDIIHPLGFYHAKAVNIIGCCKKLDDKFGGEVPSSIEDLTSLPGVGRKTANVIRGNIYHEPSIVVDTHVGRISRKLGITKKEDPKDVEFDLMKKIPRDHWILWNIHLITLGRSICKAPTPKCSECFLRDYCPTGQKNNG
ncbi:DNA-(apurinic or apyrimidinic site) lyase /endonuclease III [Lachnospiraceae bacterium G41]|nr:DNA-(apurinic or apyrimidinic site) lyase /endonuclease III [Lachnospiraceae bacterium G41]